MTIRIVSIEENTDMGMRSPSFGRYCVVFDVDGRSEELMYRVELPGNSSRFIGWEPVGSFLSDTASVPVMAVAFITDTVVRFHCGEEVLLPVLVAPRPLPPDTTVICL